MCRSRSLSLRPIRPIIYSIWDLVESANTIVSMFAKSSPTEEYLYVVSTTTGMSARALISFVTSRFRFLELPPNNYNTEQAPSNYSRRVCINVSE